MFILKNVRMVSDGVLGLSCVGTVYDGFQEYEAFLTRRALRAFSNAADGDEVPGEMLHVTGPDLQTTRILFHPRDYKELMKILKSFRGEGIKVSTVEIKR